MSSNLSCRPNLAKSVVWNRMEAPCRFKLHTLILSGFFSASPLMALANADAESSKAGEAIEEVYVEGKEFRRSVNVKLSIEPRELPQSISVVSREQIDLLGATNLGQLLLQTTGVILTGDNSERTNFSIRGFGVGDSWNSNLLQYDGVAVNASNVASSKPDMAMVERVEVLRGATGLMQGSGEPSGSINIVRKKPTTNFQANTSLSYGSWDTSRVEADISGRLTSSGALRGRLVVAKQSGNSYMDAVERDIDLAYGIVSADLTDSTVLNISYKLQTEDSVAAHNLPRNPITGADLNLDRDNCSCNASDYWNKDNSDVFVDLEHTFDNGWGVKGTYIKANYQMDMVFTSLASVSAADFDAANPQANVNKYAYQYDQDVDVVDVYTKGNFALFGQEHELVVGYNFQQSDNPGRWSSWDAVLEDYSLWNGTPEDTPSAPVLTVDLDDYTAYSLPAIAPRYDMDGGQSFEEREQEGVYVATRLRLMEPLHLVLGARQSRYDYNYQYKSNVTNEVVPSRGSSYTKSDILTPYAGITYDINRNYTVYGSFADSFVVQSTKDRNDNLLDPIQGNVYEIGLKGMFNDDAIMATIAAFRINQINRSMQDVNSAGECPQNGGDAYCYVAAGEVVSEGVEIDLRGEVLSGLTTMFGYTYNTTEYKKDPENEGRIFNETTPKHIARLFTSYQFANGLVLGGGVNYQSEWLVGRYDDVSARQEGYTLVNAMASYPITDALQLSLNASNLLDKKYYSYLSTTSNRYGEPRNINLAMRMTF